MPASRLKLFLGDGPVSASPLPLAHTTNAYNFRDICGGDKLTPSHCKFANEKILYLFYGRPAYRTHETPISSVEFSWPIVFIFDPTRIGKIRAIYPFDTGAFFLKLYSEFFDERSSVEDFKMPGDLGEASRLVDFFYGDNRSYFTGNAARNVEIPHFEFEAGGVHNLSRLPGAGSRATGARDDRSSAFEVRVSDSIEFRGSIRGIVLPQPYLQNKLVLSALERWDVPIKKYYEIFDNVSGEVWVGQIYALVRDIYKELGFLDP